LAEVRAVEQLLEADDPGALRGGLARVLLVRLDHRLLVARPRRLHECCSNGGHWATITVLRTDAYGNAVELTRAPRAARLQSARARTARVSAVPARARARARARRRSTSAPRCRTRCRTGRCSRPPASLRRARTARSPGR